MSEDLGLESNILCIPEDAFEKFQAVSMYEEEKRIIIPLATSNSEQPQSAEKMSSDSEVVLSPNSKLTYPVNSSQIDSSEKVPNQTVENNDEENDSDLIQLSDLTQISDTNLIDVTNYTNDSEMLVSNSQDIVTEQNNGLVSPSVSNNVLPRKRGRKPKNKSPKEDTPAPISIQNSDISSTPFSSDPETSDTGFTLKKRRGRPRKIRDEIPTGFQTVNYPKDMSSELSSSDNKLDDSSITKKRKRGRPKGIGRNKQVDMSLESHDQLPLIETAPKKDPQAQELQNEQLSSSYETSSKCKSPPESLIKSLDKTDDSKIDSDNDELDDICLSKLKSVPSQSNVSNATEENCISETLHIGEAADSIKRPTKVKKKRGRPKSTPQRESLSELIEKSAFLSDSANATSLKDEANNECLSKLNDVTVDKCNEVVSESNDAIESTAHLTLQLEPIGDEINDTPTKRNTKMPVMDDFEYNIDSVIGNENTNIDTGSLSADNSLLVEDTSKRSVRRKTKTFKYAEESDEDPFANVELSDDDEPRRGRKGNKYYSDDEYVPYASGKRGIPATDSTDSENSDMALIESDDVKKQRRKKLRKKSDIQSPHKKGKKEEEPKKDNEASEQKDNEHTVTNKNDIEVSLTPSVINKSETEPQLQPISKWGTTTEFENFLAKKIQGTSLKIKKVSSKEPAETSKIEIPVIDQDARKNIEMSTQTNAVITATVGSQTTSQYDIPMKETVALTQEQSEKACYFLNSIVKTTAELGLLMTQKSEDFIKKKINTTHVTDTTKMDYCVKKSFLLFKLAKHNLMQMEEDLAKQYDEYLKSNNLSKCRETQKELVPTAKEANSDSDCEIVDVKPSSSVKTNSNKKGQPKPAFNPKTVFLNKELSIKIAKKPSDNKKLDIKGRHTVWINDTVMVKKVKPTQSFLAQDSRNKKPPDNSITIDMVSDFFKGYNRQKALSVCAPFVIKDWINVSQECVCNYFVVKPLQCVAQSNYSNINGFNINNNTFNNTETEETQSVTDAKTVANTVNSSPESLVKLCVHVLNIQMHNNNFNEDNHKKRNEFADKPVTLFRLCMRSIIDNTTDKMEIYTNPDISYLSTQSKLLPLKTLCFRRIMALLADSRNNNTRGETESHLVLPYRAEELNDCDQLESPDIILTQMIPNRIKSLSALCLNYFQRKLDIAPVKQLPMSMHPVKSLFSLSVKVIQSLQSITETDNNMPKSLKTITYEYLRDLHLHKVIQIPKSLKSIAYDNIKHILYPNEQFDQHDEIEANVFMINCVNTLSEEAFDNLEEYNTDSPGIDDFDNDTYGHDMTATEDDQIEPSWVAQVQMQELRSCVNINNLDANEDQAMEPIITQIKLEPLDDEMDSSLLSTNNVNVKPEPGTGPDEMTIIPDIKPEMVEHVDGAQLLRRNSYDIDSFEQFVVSHKLTRSLTEEESAAIYSQSSERVRRQHEPDYYEENNPDMLGLLVPHTYEPLSIQTAKGSLMESSSDDNSKNTKNAPKKLTKRGRGRPKKSEPIKSDKEKQSPNEVAMLTKKMKERIRQEEKKNESTDSESELVPSRLRSREKKGTLAQVPDKQKLVPISKEKQEEKNVEPKSVLSNKAKLEDKKALPISNKKQEEAKKVSESESEFSDRTTRLRNREKKEPDQIPNTSKLVANNKGKTNEIQCSNVDSTDQLEGDVGIFNGFTPIESSEMSNYEKYMKYVYEKVLPNSPGNNKQEDVQANQIISPDEPVELLECEPTMPIFDDFVEEKPSKTKKKQILAKVPEVQFIDRHGWQCYPVNPEDPKLYQNATLVLEKLPETFVQTYFQYQNISTRDNSDQEIERLTNLNSLNRTNNIKDRKPQSTLKRDTKDEKLDNVDNNKTVETNAMDSDHDHYDELMPSDDEGPTVQEEIPPPVQKQTENILARNLLMNDNDSDEEGGVKIKKEIVEEEQHVEPKKSKTLIKTKNTVTEETGELMLTADKMMNKELTLLHAPVVMDSVKETPVKGAGSKHSKKSGSKTSPPSNKVKTEEDSSSEEEKQWVSTKEKLLKRMGKKESNITDDAKRAKLVSEFIERRENLEAMKRRPSGRSRRSRKKFLERQKQLKVLQRELFGETSTEPVGKRSVAAWKGRRNIRKVLDKKSLARSTVVANMEEFERKRRLNARQTKLRELLGCEEGVNVLVINDEVCLEYDFNEHRPVVTIHPFFTKVMKAHQYEGVKFMWDACFESLADLEAGAGGGGCILAHCMGLGKTLQVLALLHTVLTHPRAQVRRVLVCCPLSTVLNWVDEIHKWIGPVTNEIKVFELSKLKKTYERAYQLEDWYNGGGIFIIGYELFRSLSTLDPELDDVRPTIINKIRTALLDPGPDIIVCDEGHLLKNDCSVLAVAMSRVATKRRIILTGTPMQNNLREYYCMVNFVKPNLLGTYSEYSNRFENPIMNGQHRDSREEDIKLMKARTHILHKVLEGCLQRQEVSVLYPYLPKKHEYTVFITLTKCQWDLYKHYLYHYSKNMKQNSILKDFHILQKIWSHPQVLHSFQTKAQENRNKIKVEKLEDDLAREDQEEIKDVATELWWLQYLAEGDMLDSLESSNKFVVVFRILEECVALGDKVLIFSTSLFCLDALEYFLKKINKWSLGQEYYRLDGSVPAEVRQKWCREFNAENNVNTKLFLVSTRAGCLGLNMTAANRVIIMDTSWNPAHDIQSIFRVYRFGQKKDCFIYRLVAMGTMEQKIYERSVTKQAVACRVVDEQQIDRHYNMAELTELYKYDEAGVSVAGGVAVGVCDVALLRVARDAALHAVHEHDSLLRSSEQGLPEHERAAAWMQFQQEQADKQMENKLVMNVPKIALKRVQGKVYAKTVENDFIKTEIKEECITGDLDSTPPETKGRRRKKSKEVIIPEPNVPNQTEIQNTYKQMTQHFNPDEPGTSKDSNRYMNKHFFKEEMMVEKITRILIQHNFHNKQENVTDIANLVSKVRKIVQQGYVFNDGATDDLSTSIAKVLLPQNTPQASNITLCNTSTTPNIVPEPENILPEYETSNIENALDSRRKRKAALAAQQTFHSMPADVVISLDDGLDPSDTDFVPMYTPKADKIQVNKKRDSAGMYTRQPSHESDCERITASPPPIQMEKHPETIAHDIISQEVVEKVEVIPKRKRGRPPKNKTPQDDIVKPKRPVGRPRVGPKRYKEKFEKPPEAEQEFPEVPIDMSDSIVLSDEDDVRPNSIPSTVTVTSNNAPSISTIETSNTQCDDDELVPLPLALLSNTNFINIVAHTYLNGNPMLTADAATLAAQYSTLKSLKEAEQTGMDIVSGPIYDIALKVIGKKLFKTMNSQTFTNVPSVDVADVTIELKKKMQEISGRNTETKYKPGPKRKKEALELKRSSFNETTDSFSGNGNVVPIGLYETRASIQSDEFASSECILPDDDDDMHIVPYEQLAPVQPIANLPPLPPLKHKNVRVPSTSTAVKVPIPASTPVKVTIPASASTPVKVPILASTLVKVPIPASTAVKVPIPASTAVKVPIPASTSVKVPLPASTPVKVPIPASTPVKAPVPVKTPIVLNHLLDSKSSDSNLTDNFSPASYSRSARKRKSINPSPAETGHSVQPTKEVEATKTILPTNNTILCLDSDEEEVIIPTQDAPSTPAPQKNVSSLSVNQPIIIDEPIEPRPVAVAAPSVYPVKAAANNHSLLTPAVKQSVENTHPVITVKKGIRLNMKPELIAKLGKDTQPIILRFSSEDLNKKKVVQLLNSNVPSSSSLTSKVSQAPVTTQSTRAKTTVASTLPTESKPTSSPTVGGFSKIKQAKCKPGDIIKISEKGEIEVIKKLNAAPAPASTYTSINTAGTKRTSETTKTNESVSNKGKTIIKPKTSDNVKTNLSYTPTQKLKPTQKSEVITIPPERKMPKARLSISSSSSSSREPSPVDDNPLNIFKNVVHIQAADDPANARDNFKLNKEKTTQKSSFSSIKLPTTKLNKEISVKQTKDNAKPSTSLITSIKKEVASKMKSNTLPKTSTSTVNVKPVATGSKDSKTVDLTKDFPLVMSGRGAAMLNTKIEIKKRVSNTEPVARKKKKPMTLKDFDIDDIDDIIELD